MSPVSPLIQSQVVLDSKLTDWVSFSDEQVDGFVDVLFDVHVDEDGQLDAVDGDETLRLPAVGHHLRFEHLLAFVDGAEGVRNQGLLFVTENSTAKQETSSVNSRSCQDKFATDTLLPSVS